MDRLTAVRARNLFVVALLLKLASSTLGYFLHSPWVLGLAVPLAVMLGYILIGVSRPDPTLTPEKFADSCYYLGFIFTITSIIFSLFDLPNIGTQMSAIAVRFGAAMRSTVLGLGVRVILVSFRQDMDDATKLAESKVIDATYQLRDQLTIVVDKLRVFEQQVDDATTQSITRVSVGIETLTTSYGTKLSAFFGQLTDVHWKAFEQSQAQLQDASGRLTRLFDNYSLGMLQNIQSIEDRVIQFADAVEDRLQRTSFPDDYFAKGLSEPVAKLGDATTSVAQRITIASGEVDHALKATRGVLATVISLGGDVQSSAVVLQQMTRTQQSMLDESKAHIAALDATQRSLAGLSADVGEHKEATQFFVHMLNEHAARIERVVAALQAVDESIGLAARDWKVERETLKAASAGAAEGAVLAMAERMNTLVHEVQSLVTQLSEIARTSPDIVPDAPLPLIKPNGMVRVNGHTPDITLGNGVASA
jgi:biopolymer transport protein ExbB/TolQ